MKYQAQSVHLKHPHECLIIGLFEDGQTAAFNKCDQLTEGYLTGLVKSGDISGKIGQLCLLHHVPQLDCKRLIIVGCGKQQELNERNYQKIYQRLWQTLKELPVSEAVSYLTDLQIKGRNLYWNVRFAIETLEHGNYQFDNFKQQKAPAIKLQKLLFSTDDATAEQAICHAQAIAHGMRATRDLANQPPNICNPAYLAEQAQALAAKSNKVSVEILDEAQMAELGMQAYLAVSRGATNPAYLSLIKFNNAPNPDAKPIVLVGKGLTFDAGGISLKPAADMDEMKYDMGGAASVFGTMTALIELDLPLNVIGVLAGCENLPDGNAYRPGDILTTMNGLTVEVLNTDAEGRLVLCDTLTYVERFAPQAVIDIATLTGACVVALGQHNSGLLSEDDALATELAQAATQSHDKAWRLPISDEYREQLKSPFADLANVGGRWGGASTAGAFLSHFTKAYPWAHLDIAGTAWLQGANKGATGRPVPLLVQYLINAAE